MLSLPDFKQKNILLTDIPSGKRGDFKLLNENFVYYKEGKVINRISCFSIFAIFIRGDFTITSKLLKKILDNGISVFLLKDNLEVYAEIGAKAEGNYLLRERQYLGLNDFEIAKKIVQNKISNQYFLLEDKKIISNLEFKREIKNINDSIKSSKDSESLLGIEGNCSKIFFEKYFKDLKWFRRSPRTKIDINNLLLDMGYSMLFNYVDSILRLFGFDVYRGVYHKLFFQRKSLSCDLMEPLRCIIDKQLLKGFNLKIIDEKDFIFHRGSYFLKYEKSQKYVKMFLEAIAEHKEQIYSFLRNYYLFFMYENNKFPNFKLK